MGQKTKVVLWENTIQALKDGPKLCKPMAQPLIYLISGMGTIKTNEVGSRKRKKILEKRVKKGRPWERRRRKKFFKLIQGNSSISTWNKAWILVLWIEGFHLSIVVHEFMEVLMRVWSWNYRNGRIFLQASLKPTAIHSSSFSNLALFVLIHLP